MESIGDDWIRNGRDAAFMALNRYSAEGQFVATSLDRIFQRTDLAAAERSLATNLSSDTIRRLRTLDTILAQRVRRPLESLEPDLLSLLRLGANQLVFSRTPAHAAVNETVAIAARIQRKRWTGFANGVLRSVQRSVVDGGPDGAAANSAPVADNQWTAFSDKLFPDPDADFAGWFAKACSFPDWLARRWGGRFPKDELIRMACWLNAPAPPTLRVNTLRTTRRQLLTSLETGQIAAVDTQSTAGIRLLQHTAVSALPGYDDGLFTVQDESAMHAASLLGPAPGEDILDLCAAPGGKTTHLAELMSNSGRIVAADVDDGRIQMIADNTARLGIDIVETRRIPRDGSRIPDGPFDAALVDVPCSNSGVLGKRPEARWRLREHDMTQLPELQLRLLNSACDVLRPGGRVVYSTCSIEPEENSGVVNALLSRRADMELVETRDHRPGQRDTDGAWQARLEKHG